MLRLRHASAAAVLAILAGPAVALAQDDRDFTVIRDWAPIGTVDARAVGDTVILSAGTIHTNTDYQDFVFRFEYRLPSPDAAAALLFRAHQGADRDGREYAVALDGAGSTGRLSAVSMPLHQSRFTPPKAGRTRWTSCYVRVERARLTVIIDGAVVSEGSLLDLPGGRIGFRVLSGGIELRAVRVAALAETRATFHPELPVAGTPGVTLPSLRIHVAPVYPSRARRDGVSGTVFLEIVVLPDGRVGDIRVTASPHADLIQAAVDCVRKWRFNPAQKDGVPVAVAATAEVAFNLTR
jgi:TonB family protein